MKITKEKIHRKISSFFRNKRIIKCSTTLKEIKGDSSSWSHAVNDFIKNKVRDMGYFELLEKDIQTIKEYDKEEAYDVTKYLLSISICEEEKIVAYKLMERLELLSADDVKEYMGIIRNMKDLNMAFCMNIDLHSFAFRHKDVQYPKYYTDRRATIRHIAEGMSDFNDCLMTNNDSKRIAVLARTVQSIRNSAVSFYVLDDAVEIAKKGYEVTLFVSGYYFYRDEDSFIKPSFPQYDVSKEYSKEHNDFTEGLINIVYIDGKTIRERMNNCVGAIQRFNPSVIIDYSSQHAFETAVLIKMYPILYVPLSGFSTCDFFHLYMCPNVEECLNQNKIYNSFPIEMVFGYDKAIRNQLPLKKFNRNDYGLKDTDFIAVTVGYRIKYELENECVDAICSMIKEHKEIKWLIVTREEHSYIKERYSDLLESKNIVMWGFEKDISGLYTICDAYINPNRTGGGASIAYAMHAGMPILMNDYPSDALTYVGRENLTNSYSEMADYLKKLVENHDYYVKEQKRTLRRSQEYSTAHATSQYLVAIKRLKSMFEGEGQY